MAYQRLQVGRAIPIIPNDDFLIPNPATLQNDVISGTSTFVGAPGFLSDSTKNFTTLGVKVGDTIVTADRVATVTGVGTSNVNIQGSSIPQGTPYVIYSLDPLADKNNGCTLYIGLAGNITVETVGGDVTTFTGMPTGSFMPVFVRKVKDSGTDAQSIVALW